MASHINFQKSRKILGASNKIFSLFLTEKKIKNTGVCVTHNKHDGEILELLQDENSCTRNRHYCWGVVCVVWFCFF